MNNSELIVRMLEQAGVRWVLWHSKRPVLPLIEARAEVQSSLC
jgi:hypothetical protein